jgi:epoxyqueuosine reductase
VILAKNIKDRALFEGFNKVGIVGAESLEDEGRRLQEWLARGHHGEMSWMAREVHKRISPQEIFPPARSVVVVALNYFTPHQHQDDPATGKVSRYAWGDDYHDVVKEKLLSLLLWINEQEPRAEGKICVDIQPTMDKAWAVRAGLGWLGKHSNVITREFGSWVFIGELFLNLDLDYDAEPMEDHCGTCTLCIDACPTAAITEPYLVDSNKCI